MRFPSVYLWLFVYVCIFPDLSSMSFPRGFPICRSQRGPGRLSFLASQPACAHRRCRDILVKLHGVWFMDVYLCSSIACHGNPTELAMAINKSLLMDRNRTGGVWKWSRKPHCVANEQPSTSWGKLICNHGITGWPWEHGTWGENNMNFGNNFHIRSWPGSCFLWWWYRLVHREWRQWFAPIPGKSTATGGSFFKQPDFHTGQCWAIRWRNIGYPAVFILHVFSRFFNCSGWLWKSPRFYTPHTTLHTAHATLDPLHTPHSTLYTPHSSLQALHSHTPHFHTPQHSTLHHTLHSTHTHTLLTPHSTLLTPHSTRYTPHSTHHNTPRSTTL